ncbi:MAG: hypothetical protein LC754_06595 [Acidobacteria bacterium]|nr:hypothetical protein [Acidobacteriota bacterium]
MKREAVEVSCSVPIRRSLWTSFRIGVGALVVSLLLAVALAGLLLLLLPVNVNGAVIIIIFGLLWFGIFFISLPRQRRYARSLDLRRPGIRLADGLLTIPVDDDLTLYFKLDEPHEMLFGWYEVLIKSTGGPTTNTRGLMTYAILSQAGQQLLLKAEESVREAQAAGWPNATRSATPALSVRLWASDLVILIEAMRARPTVAELRTSESTELCCGQVAIR